MAQTLEPDLCVIGSGPGAIAVAIGAATQGVRAVLVRHGPSSSVRKHQALLAAARQANAARSAATFGIRTGEVSVDFGSLADHVRHVAAAVAPNETPERLTGLGIRVIDGSPCFKNASAVAIGDDFEIKARHFVIATGSTAVMPDIEGLGARVLTPDTVFDLAECPEGLAVIGASAQSLELAQVFLRLGASVTVIDPEAPLPEEDAECSAILLQRLQAQGLKFVKGRVLRAATSGQSVDLTVEKAGGRETIAVSHVLSVNGRRPALDDLNLGAGGVAFAPAGVIVDDHLRSSNSKVFAIGDAIGVHSVQAANQHAAIVLRNALSGAKSVANEGAVPRAIFTDPEFAHVGLDEQRARALYRTIRIQRWPFSQNDRAQAERDTVGHIKAVTLQDGTIVGATIVGRGAADQIGSLALAIDRGLGLHDLLGWILPHPSRAEAGKLALTPSGDAGLTRPRQGRIISLLRRRG